MKDVKVFDYRIYTFAIGVVANGCYGITMSGQLIEQDKAGMPFDGTMEETQRYAESLIDEIILNRFRSGSLWSYLKGRGNVH